MKTIIFLTSFMWTILAVIDAQELSDRSTSELLDQVLKSFPERYRDPPSIVERNIVSLERSDVFLELESRIKDSWASDLPVMAQIAHGEGEMAVYFKAAQSLPKVDYLKFMLETAKHVESGAIGKQQFKWCIFPGSKHLREMWMENPPSETLKEIALKAAEIYAEDASMQTFFNRVIAGEVARERVWNDDLSSGPSSNKTKTATRPSVTHDRAQAPFERRPTSKVTVSVSALLDNSATISWKVWAAMALAALALLCWFFKRRVDRSSRANRSN